MDVLKMMAVPLVVHPTSVQGVPRLVRIQVCARSVSQSVSPHSLGDRIQACARSVSQSVTPHSLGDRIQVCARSHKAGNASGKMTWQLERHGFM